MQFELNTCTHNAVELTAALRRLDPNVSVVVDEAGGHLEVISNAARDQVQRVLADIGCEAKPVDNELHISGGTTCCGGCS